MRASFSAPEDPVLGDGRRVSLWFPHQMEAIMGYSGGKQRGRNDLPSFSLGKGQIPQEPVEAAGALPSWPSLPQASGRTTASASPKDEQGPWWLEMLFSSLFYIQCPRKTFC